MTAHPEQLGGRSARESDGPQQDLAGEPVSLALRLAVAALGFSSVTALLGWVYGIATFRVLYRLVSLPGAVGLVALAVWATASDRRGLRDILAIGSVAGLLGTIGYDVARIPFVYGGGFLLLSPVESYGVLAAGAETSSGWTDFLGWSYHLTNGVGFGVAYAALAFRRHWGWGVAFALVLETGAVVTPFASAYQLEGKYFLIAVAYGAHVPYGLALGKLCQDPAHTRRILGVVGRHTAPVSVIAAVAALAVWLGPWSLDPDIERGRDVAEGPSMIIQSGRVSPEFVVLTPGSCVTVANSDDVERALTLQDEVTSLRPGELVQICPDNEGVFRLKSDAGAFTGGFLIVDPEL